MAIAWQTLRASAISLVLITTACTSDGYEVTGLADDLSPGEAVKWYCGKDTGMGQVVGNFRLVGAKWDTAFRGKERMLIATDSRVEKGMSGCGILDDHNELVGIVLAYTNHPAIRARVGASDKSTLVFAPTFGAFREAIDKARKALDSAPKRE